MGDPEIQKFNGTVWQIHGADIALFLSAGRPTAPARQLAALVGIVIVDRHELAQWAAFGVSPIPDLLRVG